MFKKLLTFISFIFVIAIFALLFKLSLPEVTSFILKTKFQANIEAVVKGFFSSLSENELKSLNAMPCPNKQDCEGADLVKGKFFQSFSKDVADKSLIVSESGAEIFTGQQLSQAYINLVKDTKTAGKNYYTERTNSNSGGRDRIILIKKLSDIVSIPSFADKYIFIIFDNKKVEPTEYLIAGLATLLPLLLIAVSILLKARRHRARMIVLETENHETKDALESLRKENHLQTQFLANFTHELRTPLNSIIGFSGLIKDETMGPLGSRDYVKYANDINTSGLHLLGLINDILDYSKSEAGRLKINLTEVDLVKITKQCFSIVAPRANESKVDLLQSFNADYYIVKLDPKRFKQIILNLLSNSVKFTPEGGSVKVSVFTDLTNEKVFVEVKDTGVGIAEKDIPTAMALFGQIETNLNRKYEGTGIGLPFAKKLTNLMGGTFELTSALGTGTTITITLPFDKKLNAEYAELYKKGGSEPVEENSSHN